MKLKAIYIILICQFSLNTMALAPAPNISSSTSSYYPFTYINSDGTYNFFGTFISALNVFNPIFNTLCYKLGNIYIKKWDKDIDKDIEELLKDIKNSEERVREILVRIIVDFNNGIDKSNFMVLRGIIDSLNRYDCIKCIDKFVNIVSKDIEKKNKRKKNKKEFKIFVSKMTDKNGQLKCGDNHIKETIPKEVSQEKAFTGKAKAACCAKWTHPLHWTSMSYTWAAFFLPPLIALGLSTDTKSGSVIGDMANISNILCIPTAYAFTVWQYYMNTDRIKNQKLKKEIENRLAAIHGIIEIASLTIDKMDNHINKEQARYILTALVLMGWPENIVNKFETLASNKKSIKEDIDNFIEKIEKKYKEKAIPYDNPIPTKASNLNEVVVEDNEDSE